MTAEVPIQPGCPRRSIHTPIDSSARNASSERCVLPLGHWEQKQCVCWGYHRRHTDSAVPSGRSCAGLHAPPLNRGSVPVHAESWRVGPGPPQEIVHDLTSPTSHAVGSRMLLSANSYNCLSGEPLTSRSFKHTVGCDKGMLLTLVHLAVSPTISRQFHGTDFYRYYIRHRDYLTVKKKTLRVGLQ